MPTSRRNFIRNTTLAGMAGMVSPLRGLANTKVSIKYPNNERPKVLFFDVNGTLLDLSVLNQSVEKVLNGRSELVPLWFTTMLQYSLVATTGNNYEDFGEIGAATLTMVAGSNDIQLSMERAKEAISPIKSLQPHPEVKDALKELKKEGYKLVSFTNSSSDVAKKQLENAGLVELFDERLSIDSLEKYKPHTDTYNWAARKMGHRPHECMLIAAHGWDIAGAIWAGWQAAFISRPGQQLYPLAPKPEMVGSDLQIISEKLIALEK